MRRSSRMWDAACGRWARCRLGTRLGSCVAGAARSKAARVEGPGVHTGCLRLQLWQPYLGRTVVLPQARAESSRFKTNSARPSLVQLYPGSYRPPLAHTVTRWSKVRAGQQLCTPRVGPGPSRLRLRRAAPRGRAWPAAVPPPRTAGTPIPPLMQSSPLRCLTGPVLLRSLLVRSPPGPEGVLQLAELPRWGGTGAGQQAQQAAAAGRPTAGALAAASNGRRRASATAGAGTSSGAQPGNQSVLQPTRVTVVRTRTCLVEVAEGNSPDLPASAPLSTPFAPSDPSTLRSERRFGARRQAAAAGRAPRGARGALGCCACGAPSRGVQRCTCRASPSTAFTLCFLCPRPEAPCPCPYWCWLTHLFPLQTRLWFAGEHTSSEDAYTMHGAMCSGAIACFGSGRSACRQCDRPGLA